MATPVPDSILQGRYRLVAQLAEGGMGVTFRAWDLRQGRPVVVKRPRFPGIEQGSLEYAERVSRFGREVQAMRGLPHDHIVPIIDSGIEDSGVPFAVMPYLPGGSLSDTRKRGGGTPYEPCRPSTLHAWLPVIAEALDFIHSQGVLHRDVKPANIFFDGFSNAFLGDFGIAKAISGYPELGAGTTLTATHLAIGTPEYMAPEACAPNSVPDGKADQYSLAVLVYEMLAGQRPFTGATAHLVVEHATRPVPPLNATGLALPKSLIAAVERGLSKVAADRFPTCREFARAVLAEVSPRPINLSQAKLLCPGCRKVLRIPRTADGGQGTCPACNERLEIAKDFSALWISGEQDRAMVAPPQIAFQSAADNGSDPLFSATTENHRPGEQQAAGRWYPLARAIALLVGLMVIGVATAPAARRWVVPAKRANDVISAIPQESTLSVPQGGNVDQDASAVVVADDAGPRNDETAGSVREESEDKDEEAVSPLPASESTVATEAESAAEDQIKPRIEVATDNSSVVTNSIGMKLVAVPAGKFFMGPPLMALPTGLHGRDGKEIITNTKGVRHEITISEDYFIGATEVTNAQFKSVMGYSPNPPLWDESCPVAGVSWHEAMQFCLTLSESPEEKMAGRYYRLPTEAEWEYACRAGSKGDFFFGDDIRLMSEYAWFGEPVEQPLHIVAQKKPNALGLYDTYGNAAEWCSDQFSPFGDRAIDVRSVRGGAWYSAVGECSSASRSGQIKTSRVPGYGMRVVLDVGQKRTPARKFATIPRVSFDAIVRESGAAWEDVKSCVVSEEGDMVTVDVMHPQYPLSPVGSETPDVPEKADTRRSGVRNSIGMTFKLVSPRTFVMGSSVLGSNSLSPRKVTLTKPFYIGVYEVKYGEWRSIMGLPKNAIVSDDIAVDFANWFKAEQFCKKLSGRPAEREAGRRYRLPTEAEWESACRGGSLGNYCFGDDERQLKEYALYSENNGMFKEPVGQYKPNSLGLYDMHGNVWEWCSDWFDDFGSREEVDPKGPAKGLLRVMKGGGRESSDVECVSASRRQSLPSRSSGDCGFRVVLELPDSFPADDAPEE